VGKKSKLRLLIEQKKRDLEEVKKCRDSQIASANARVEALEEVIRDLEKADISPVSKATD